MGAGLTRGSGEAKDPNKLRVPHAVSGSEMDFRFGHTLFMVSTVRAWVQ